MSLFGNRFWFLFLGLAFCACSREPLDGVVFRVEEASVHIGHQHRRQRLERDVNEVWGISEPSRHIVEDILMRASTDEPIRIIVPQHMPTAAIASILAQIRAYRWDIEIGKPVAPHRFLSVSLQEDVECRAHESLCDPVWLYVERGQHYALRRTKETSKKYRKQKLDSEHLKYLIEHDEMVGWVLNSSSPISTFLLAQMSRQSVGETLALHLRATPESLMNHPDWPVANKSYSHRLAGAMRRFSRNVQHCHGETRLKNTLKIRIAFQISPQGHPIEPTLSKPNTSQAQALAKCLIPLLENFVLPVPENADEIPDRIEYPIVFAVAE